MIMRYYLVIFTYTLFTTSYSKLLHTPLKNALLIIGKGAS